MLPERIGKWNEKELIHSRTLGHMTGWLVVEWKQRKGPGRNVAMDHGPSSLFTIQIDIYIFFV